MLALSPGDRRLMGARARQRVERDFDERTVVEATLDAVKSALASRTLTRIAGTGTERHDRG
jgi:hypothetical protein